ncbi:hypothetical protein BMIN_0839 [Bifidobacterium minimum]|uniref:Uncharacterized protein n=1 Tax=Bifidobacterium minimum TaxID=1693 RepID=A0A087BQ15_9BIFI|nr:hypothetical protein [Bifidobacterium minimum]KFI73115.1 hypothetical protein BMIN_0839 [Bifidobacterium minimum]
MSASMEGRDDGGGRVSIASVSHSHIRVEGIEAEGHGGSSDCPCADSAGMDVVVRSSVEVTVDVEQSSSSELIEEDAVPGASGRSSERCFDPECSCDERERALIEMLRAYLRPTTAPECLLRRLRDTIDHCCHDEIGDD